MALQNTRTIKKQSEFYLDTGITSELINIRNIRPHYHSDTLEFIYCLKGRVYANVAHELCIINEHELVTVDHDDIKNIYAYDDNITLLVHLDLNNTHIPSEDLRNTLFSCASMFSAGKTDSIDKVIDHLLSLIYAQCLYHSDIKSRKWFLASCASIRLNIIDLMMDKFSWFSIYDEPEDDMKYRERLRQIISYVSLHFKEKITLSQLSKIIYLNPAYISSFLHRASFNSFTDLVNYYRCLHAQKLLLETNLPVGDISVICGFSSEKYFYRSFKSYFKSTPHKYRKHMSGFIDKEEKFIPFTNNNATKIIKDYISERHIKKSL